MFKQKAPIKSGIFSISTGEGFLLQCFHCFGCEFLGSKDQDCPKTKPTLMAGRLHFTPQMYRMILLLEASEIQLAHRLVGSWNLPLFTTRWWFQIIFSCSPLPGEMIQFWLIFFNGVETTKVEQGFYAFKWCVFAEQISKPPPSTVGRRWFCQSRLRPGKKLSPDILGAYCGGTTFF